MSSSSDSEWDSVIRSRFRRDVDRESAKAWHEEWNRAANRIYANWQWLQVEFEGVCEALAVIDPERGTRQLEKDRVIDLSGYLDGTATPEELDELYQNAYGRDSMEVASDDPRIVWSSLTRKFCIGFYSLEPETHKGVSAATREVIDPYCGLPSRRSITDF